MAIYTYSDFEKAATDSGLLEGFSSSDLRLAKMNPDVGMTLLKYKADYAAAKNTSVQKSIENTMNQIRSKYGGYTEQGGSMVLSAPTAANFNYSSKYADRINALTEAISNRKPFSYDAESDPNFTAQRKAYIRDSRRAVSDAVAESSAMTGGIPSSYAATAAAQAGDYHASQFSDKYTELYNAAYNRYLNEHSMNQSELETLLGADQTDRNFAYTEHMNKVGAQDSSGYSGYSSYSNSNYSGLAYGGTNNKTSSGSSSGNTSSSNNSGIAAQLPSPSTGKDNASTESETDTPTVSDLLPKPDDEPISSADGSTVVDEKVTTEDGKSNYNAGWINSGKTRDEYDASVRGNDTSESSGKSYGSKEEEFEALVKEAGGFSSAYSQLKELGYAPLSKAQFERMKAQGNGAGQIAPAEVARYDTYESYLGEKLKLAMY